MACRPNALGIICVSIFTFVLVKQVNWHPESVCYLQTQRVGHMCQYSYFCTSKASKLAPGVYVLPANPTHTLLPHSRLPRAPHTHVAPVPASQPPSPLPPPPSVTTPPPPYALLAPGCQWLREVFPREDGQISGTKVLQNLK